LGLCFALVNVAALVTLAVLVGDLITLGIAAIGALQVLPATVMHFFPGALTAPLALLAVGLVLLAAALYATRRRVRGKSRRKFRYEIGSKAGGAGYRRRDCRCRHPRGTPGQYLTPAAGRPKVPERAPKRGLSALPREITCR
jgi:hypothetical protein